MSQSPPKDDIPLRERNKIRTRKALSRAAMTLYKEQGFENTTIDQIAAAADVSRRTFFRYFPCKEAVCFPHAHDWMEGLARQMESRAEGEPPFAALRRAAASLAREFEASREHLLFQKTLVSASPALTAYEKQVNARWSAVVEAGLMHGGVVSAAHRRQLRIFAGAVTGALLATVQQWLDDGARADLVEAALEAMDLLEYGLVQNFPELTG